MKLTAALNVHTHHIDSIFIKFECVKQYIQQLPTHTHTHTHQPTDPRTALLLAHQKHTSVASTQSMNRIGGKTTYSLLSRNLK